MRAATASLLLFILCATVGVSALAQTTSGTSATIVVPLLAQTGSFASEVSVYNPNGTAITVNPAFYDAQNTQAPGLKPCTSLVLPAGRSVEFSVASQCALPAVPNFGLLILTEQAGTQRFYGYVRTQTPQGVGFSTEGFPIENFNDQLQHATGLKRKVAAGGLPAYQTNCFVTSLGDAISYELRLFDGATNVQLGGTLSGSLQAFQQFRYLDVFAQAGVAAGDRSNVRAEFTNLTGSSKKLIGFCTVQENTTFSADFRIAKSYGGTPQNAFVQGGNAFGTTALLGTTDNQPLHISVNNQRVVRYEPNGGTPNIVAGYEGNQTSAGLVGQVIAGGGQAGQCTYPTRGTFPCANATGESYASVGGGRGNLASGQHSSVGGGGYNGATNFFATVSGGAGNLATGNSSVVMGGSGNIASGSWSVVAGNGNVANGSNAVAGGGSGNVADGSNSVVGGGSSNVASGSYAIVAGGLSSAASANHTFAAGRRAKATTTGSFIWADSQNFDFQPSVNNFFGVRATGGVGLTVAINGSTGAVTQFCNLLPGVASWQCTSDRNAKENFAAIDSRVILERLVAMPLTTWNFKGADPRVRLLGPTAQDFHAAFGLGNDDKTIVGTNLHGVALAAVQGLHEIVQANQAQMRALLADKDRELAALRERVAQLEELRGDMSSIQATLRALRKAPLRQPANDVHAAAP